MGAISGLATFTATGVTTPSTANITIAVANVEESYAFPANTKHFKLKNVGSKILKIAYVSGETTTKPFTIYPGETHAVDGITAGNVTIYLQSPGTIPVQLEIWQ